MQRLVQVRLIIWRRGADGGDPSRAASASLPRLRSFRRGDGNPELRSRSGPVPATCGREPQSLRIGGGQPLLRGSTKERQDAVYLRSARAGILRERAFSPFRDAALLVLATTSGAADRYLGSVPPRIALRPSRNQATGCFLCDLGAFLGDLCGPEIDSEERKVS